MSYIGQRARVVVPASFESLRNVPRLGGHLLDMAEHEMHHCMNEVGCVPYEMTLIWQGVSTAIPEEYQDGMTANYGPFIWLYLYQAIAVEHAVP